MSGRAAGNARFAARVRIGKSIRLFTTSNHNACVQGVPGHPTFPLLAVTDFPKIRRGTIETLQVNPGYRCNQTCVHCHVNAGRNRTEEMSAETAGAVIAFEPDADDAGPDGRAGDEA